MILSSEAVAARFRQRLSIAFTELAEAYHISSDDHEAALALVAKIENGEDATRFAKAALAASTPERYAAVVFCKCGSGRVDVIGWRAPERPIFRCSECGQEQVVAGFTLGRTDLTDQQADKALGDRAQLDPDRSSIARTPRPVTALNRSRR